MRKFYIIALAALTALGVSAAPRKAAMHKGIAKQTTVTASLRSQVMK